MTTEQKEKAYEMALEAARKELGVDRKEWEVVQQVLHNIFPQLRESEDERIRVFLLDYAIEMIAGLESDISCSTYDGIKGHDPEAEAELAQWQKARAYLEKQKELTPADGWDYADKRMSHPLYLEGFEAGLAVERELSEFEKQKEHKPNIELIQRSWYMAGYNDRKFGNEPKWIIKTGKGGPKHELNPKYGQPLADEQKPAECIEDSVKFEEGFKAGRESGLRDGQKYVLNNLDSYGLCKSAEWSEEDEDMLNCCISSIEEAKENRYAYKETDGDTSYDREIAFLKSLRPSWKPSEEQEEPEYYQHFDPDC